MASTSGVSPLRYLLPALALLGLLAAIASLGREPVTTASDIDLGEPEWTRDDDRLIVQADIAPSTESMLLTVALDDPFAPLTLIELRAPDGTTRHREDPEDESAFDSDIAGTSFSSAGELALYLPLDRRPLHPGRWQATYALDADADVRRLALLQRAAQPATRNRKLSVAFGLTVPPEELAPFGGRDGLLDALRSSMQAVLAPHALSVSVDWIETPALSEFATIDVDTEDLGQACRAARAQLADPLTLPILLIEGFASEDDSGIDETIGLSPQPGVVFDPDSSESCAAVVLDGSGDDHDEITRARLLGATVLHEAGHFMGLDHSSEADGRIFDRLADTGRCDITRIDGRYNERFDVAGERDGLADDFECGVAGGASNLMFWSGVAEFAPFTLSPSQAAVLRRHPLFRPTERY